MSLNDHISDRADWRCTEYTPELEQCARWQGHTLLFWEGEEYDHLSYLDVLGMFNMVLGVYEGFTTDQVVEMFQAGTSFAKLLHFRACTIYNSKVYIQGVDTP